MLGFLFVPVYITSGVSYYVFQFWTAVKLLKLLLFKGGDNARIFIKEIWRETTSGYDGHLVTLAIYFYKSVGKWHW